MDLHGNKLNARCVWSMTDQISHHLYWIEAHLQTRRFPSNALPWSSDGVFSNLVFNLDATMACGSMWKVWNGLSSVVELCLKDVLKGLLVPFRAWRSHNFCHESRFKIKMKRRNRFRKSTGNGNGLGLWTLWFAKLSLIPSSLPFGNRKSAAESRFPQSLFFRTLCSACSTWWFLRLERSSTLAFTIFEFALWQVLAEPCSFSPNHQERIPENCCLYLIMSYYDLQHIFDFIHLYNL